MTTGISIVANQSQQNNQIDKFKPALLSWQTNAVWAPGKSSSMMGSSPLTVQVYGVEPPEYTIFRDWHYQMLDKYLSTDCQAYYMSHIFQTKRSTASPAKA